MPAIENGGMFKFVILICVGIIGSLQGYGQITQFTHRDASRLTEKQDEKLIEILKNYPRTDLADDVSKNADLLDNIHGLVIGIDKKIDIHLHKHNGN
tara:strand:+ start:169 stop:459 length:291 start_codon:yes stop_codon:yes gene_type:complete